MFISSSLSCVGLIHGASRAALNNQGLCAGDPPGSDGITAGIYGRQQQGIS